MKTLFEDWLSRQNSMHNTQSALSTLKGRVAQTRKVRHRTIKWAEELLPVVRRARDEIGSCSLTELADWLNQNHYFTAVGNRFASKNMGATLFSVGQLIAKDAVLECRTKMSALALSAEFNISDEDARPLEVECLERIKRGIALNLELETGAVAWSDDRLTKEAKQIAIAEAARQRLRYEPMLARDCYLTEAEFHEVVPDIERMILMSVASEVGQ